MEVKNLFDQSTYQEINDRLNKLSASSERQWGKMTAAQMMAHCKEAFKVPLSSKPLSRSTMGILFGWMMKSKLFNTSPWGKNLPTAPNFRIKDERSFEEEKNDLVSIVSNFHKKGASGIGDKVHPMFGKLTAEQWGLSMWKHLDHHLRQFGV
jgi:Protein of unknown function (DUF1569)